MLFRSRVGRGDVLELLDVADADRDAELDPLGNRPVRTLHGAQQVVDAVTQHDHHIIHRVAQAREPGGARNDPVELIAVHDEQTFASGGLVNPLAVNLKLALHKSRFVEFTVTPTKQ